MDLLEKGVALIFSLLILGQAYVVRRRVGTWLFPGCLFGLFWFGYTFIPLLLLLTVPVSAGAIGFIALCTVTFSAGGLLHDWRAAFDRNARKLAEGPGLYDNGVLRLTFFLAVAAASVCLVANSLTQGITVNDLVFNFYVSAATYAEMRYSDAITVNIWGQLSLVFAYLGATLGGFTVDSSESRARRLTVVGLAFIPAVFVTITQSARGFLFLCIVFFYAAVLVSRLARGQLRLLEPGDLKVIGALTLVLVPVVTISFLAKGLYDVEDTDAVLERLLTYFASYSSAHIYAFSDWFTYAVGGAPSQEYVGEGRAYGFYTFMALFKLFGSDRTAPPGVYEEYFSHGEFLTSNIYTMFRGLILDFGFGGTFLFMFGSGAAIHVIFHALLINRRPSFSAAAFITAVGYFYTSFIISLFMWNMAR